MADHSDSPSSSRQLHPLFLSLMIGGGVSVVLSLFTIGYLTLTTPEPVPDDIYTIMQKAKAKAEADKAGNSEDAETAVADNATLLPDGTFDFSKYSYYSFPLPFVSNLASGKGMLTAEVAIATYGNTLAGEKVIKQLETFNPKYVRQSISNCQIKNSAMLIQSTNATSLPRRYCKKLGF